jgi:hypothetical protein
VSFLVGFVGLLRAVLLSTVTTLKPSVGFVKRENENIFMGV